MVASQETRPSARRDFLKGTAFLIGGLIGTALGVPALAYLLSPGFGQQEEGGWIDLGSMEGFGEDQPTPFEFTRTRVNGWERTAVSYGGFVVRQGSSTARVFSDICTHLGCRVHWRPELQHYVSPCHDGHFDVLGRNISGPPPRPLDAFTTRIEGDHLLIALPPVKRNS